MARKVLFGNFGRVNASISLLQKLNSLFSRQMLDVEADGQHSGKAAFNLFLQSLILIGIIAVAQQSGYLQFLLLSLDDADSAKSYHTTVECGVPLWLHIILLDDTKGCLIALADGIDLMSCQSAMEKQFSFVINIADRHGIRIIIVT